MSVEPTWVTGHGR